MILKVARLGHPVVRTAAKPVLADQIRTAEFQKLLADMVDTMRDYNGVGLAAPQVHVPLRVAVLEIQPTSLRPQVEPLALTFLINPMVEVLDRETVDDWEGCLSIPEFRGLVPRHRQIRLTALGRNAEALEMVASDFHARVIQHEVDHLKGEVYIDRMPNLRSLAHLAEWQRYSSGLTGTPR